MDYFSPPIFYIVFSWFWIGAESSDIYSLLSTEQGDFCISNSSSAIYYTNDEGVMSQESRLIPRIDYFCDFERNGNHKSCINDFAKLDNWQIVDSLNYENYPIFDSRWEVIPIKELKHTKKKTRNKKPSYLSFDTLLKINQQNFEVTLSLRSTEAHFLFCDSEEVSSASCYWFILQGWGRNKTVLRKCQKQIPTIDGEYPERPCSDPIDLILHPQEYPYYLSMNEWSHIKIKKEGSTFFLGQIIDGGIKKILETTDQQNLYNIHYMIGHTKNQIAYCKIHRSDYLRTTDANSYTPEIPLAPFAIKDNRFCLSLMFASCEKCSAEIFLLKSVLDPENPGRTQLQTFYKEELKRTTGAWKYNRIESKNFEDAGYVRIGIKTIKLMESNDHDYFWSIDDIRQCHLEEYRVTPKQKQNQLHSCHFIENSKEVLNQDDTKYIPNGTCEISDGLGEGCIPCNILKENGLINSCQNIKICDDGPGYDKCYCTRGYTGANCRKECQPGTFGYGCQNKCGNCLSTCNVEDGRCYCNPLFEGPTCKEPKNDVMLKKSPELIYGGVDYCTIRVEFNEYIGKEPPKFYLAQYQKINSRKVPLEGASWKDSTKVEKVDENGQLKIGELDSSSQYFLRVLVSSEEHRIRNLQSFNIPYTLCNTSCNGWDKTDIQLAPRNESVWISIAVPKDKCHSSTYQWILEMSNGTEIKRGTTSFAFLISELEPFTNYQILFDGAKNLLVSFQTLEGVPSDVQGLTIAKPGATSIELHWQEPDNFHGNFQYYKIIYRRRRSRSCKDLHLDNEQNTTTENNNIELTNLVPFSIYSIKVYVVNNKFESEGKYIRGETSGSETIDETEGLEEVKIKLKEIQERVIQFEIKNINCQKLRGELKISFDHHCINEWCNSHNKTEYDYSSKDEIYTIRNLKPFSNYSVSISFCRNENCSKFANTSVLTKAGVPNSISDLLVTSKGSNYIKLRWIPPFPPTGTLNKYRIITTCDNCYSSYRYEYIQYPENCRIWPKFHCVKLTNNIFGGYEHSIAVQASNEENSVWADVANPIKILVKESAPDPPYNFNVKWNINNTVELSWNHPNRSNGDLTVFFIYITLKEGKISKKISVNEATYQLNYKVAILEKFPASQTFEMSVSAVNIFSNQSVSKTESSYPPVPEVLNPIIKILNYTKTTITISLNSTKKDETTVLSASYMFVFIKESNEKNEDENVKKLTEVLNTTLANFRLVNEIDLSLLESKNINFTIGEKPEIVTSKLLGNPIKNVPLNEGRSYNITVIFVNEFKQKFRYYSFSKSYLTDGDASTTTPGSTSEENHGEESSTGTLILVFLLLLILIPIIIVVIIYRENIIKMTPSISFEKILDMTVRDPPQVKESDEAIPLGSNENIIIAPKPIVRVKPKLSTKRSTNPPNSADNIYSKLIKIGEFDEYVRTAIQTGQLEKQHSLFPRGQTQPWTYGSMKVNKPKNRYNNLIAYDHSRVKLEKITGDEYSDYINASYIDGYNVSGAYIATQGPKAATLEDFWKMIWQENVRYIVMLANILEGGKKKVEQYWPIINEELNFGDICVQYQSVELFANFEYRIFQVVHQNETRKVEQLHFTTWPDHGVPLYPQSLVPFLRKILKIPLSSMSPVVVHCSAGVGRTGTILLCDISLRMAAKEGTVDMLNNLQKLREQRPNMVDNVEQYKLAHLVVLECLMGLNTSIPCNENMDRTIEKLIGDREYITQMEYLRETEWQDQAMKSVAECLEEFVNYPEKDRFEEIVPENQGRLFLTRYPNDDPASSYINAVQVDGFRNPSRFIVTQQPMPNTVGDFWRMVVERQINVIISLNEINLKDKTCCEFWPTEDEPELQPVDFILVKFGKIVELENYDIYSLQVWVKTNEKEQMNVELVAFKKWNSRNELPTSLEDFLAFWEEADNITRRSNNVIVTCFDGATACGVYVALSFTVEKMKLEQECDVCLAVRTIRHNRRHFIKGESQFIFLYEAAAKYINGFQSYANFRNQ